MPKIKKISPLLNLSNFQTFIFDTNPLSQYFKISELGDLLTSGKNAFLIEGSTFLKPSTEIKIEVLDTEGNPLFVQPGEGLPEYYEGLSKLISIHVYEDTPIGIGKITILGELDTYLDENGFPQPIPDDWKGIYNIKWEKEIKINKNIPNETRIRFVRKPEIIIEELNESFYSRNLVNATQTNDTVRGIALTPSEGTQLRGYRGGLQYLIKKESGEFLDGGTFISVTGTNIQNAEVVEYLNNSSIIVSTPFTSLEGLVSNFTNKNYSLSYQYNQNPVESSILGSFGRFEINNLKTFVGDVERVKVFKKSRSSNSDFAVIQDTRVDASELLSTIISGSTVNVGFFSQSYENGQSYNNFWTINSNGNPNEASLDSTKIYKGIKLQNSRLSSNLGDNIRLESGSEYVLEFYNYYDTSSNNSNDTLNVYLTSTLRSGSGISNYYLTQSLATFTGSNEFRGANKKSFNFEPSITDNWNINFEANNTTPNSYWQVGSVTLKASNEIGFSPDEFQFTIPIDRDLEQETFDFKFEFFDINNNFVPISLSAAKTFQSGNIGVIDKDITIDLDKQFFNFSSSLEGLPTAQTINIVGTKNRILGNLLITSQAFDTGGIAIPAATYSNAGFSYPGGLTGFSENTFSLSASLNIASFTGSLHTSSLVDRITYTLTEVSSSQPFIKRFTIGRLVAGASGVDGDDSKGLFVSSNSNQFLYKATDLSLNPSGQTILFQAKRQNIATVSNLITVNSGSGKPQLTSVSDVDGVKTFSLSGNLYSHSFGETIYSFTSSDAFGVDFSDFVKITPVKILDGLSATLTNDNASLPALSTGFVASGDFVFTSGSVNVKVGNETITFDDNNDGNRANNTFAIINLSGVGCTPNGGEPNDPSENVYGITALAADSGSLNITIDYKDGAGDSTSLIKTVTYTKNKKAAPVLEFIIGNNNQSVTAKSTGEQIDTFVTASFTVNEAYNGVTTSKTFTTSSVTATNSYQIGTATNTTLALPNMANGTDSVDISVTGSVVDSENTTRLVFGNISLAKIKKAAPVLAISSTPKDQSVTAKSTGVQIDSFANATIVVKETYNGSTNPLPATLTATRVDTGGSLTVNNSTGVVTLTTQTLAPEVNSTTINISAVVEDSEGTSRTLTDTLSLSKVKKAVPLVLITASPQAQTVIANAAGTQTGTLSNVTISALEGTTSRFTSMVIASTSGFSTLPTVSGATLTMTSAVMNAAEASVTLTVTHTDSEGTSGQTQTIIVRATKVPTGEKGDQGDPGENGDNGANGLRTATGMVHYQITSATAPANPTATSYTFSNGTFSGLTANWGTGAPTYASGNTNKYWYSFFTAVETSPASGVGNVTFGNSTQAIGFSGLVSFTGVNGVSDGSNALTFGVAGTTLINGSNISTGKITSTNINLGAGFNYTNGKYVTAGTLINLDAGSIHTKNFFISSSGDAEFKGNLSAAGGTFSGTLQAVGGDFEGTITAGTGSIGGWRINNTSIFSVSGSNNVAIVNLNSSADGSIVINSRNSAVATPVVLMNGGTTFASYDTSTPLAADSIMYADGLSVISSNVGANQTQTFYRGSSGTSQGNVGNGIQTFNVVAGRSYQIVAKNLNYGPYEIAAEYTGFGPLYRMMNESRMRLVGAGSIGNLGGSGWPDNGTSRGVVFGASAILYQGMGDQVYFAESGFTNTNTFTATVTETIHVFLEADLQLYAQSGVISAFNFPPSSIGVSEVTSYSELNGAGFQAGETSTKFIKVRRQASNFGGTGTTTMLEVGGAIVTTGNIIAFFSDKRLKNILGNIDNPLEKINKLNGVYYEENELAESFGYEKNEKKQVGLIAQEVQEVLPEIVYPAPFDSEEDGSSKSGKNYLTIQYEKIVPLLVECIKELKKEINELKENK